MLEILDIFDEPVHERSQERLCFKPGWMSRCAIALPVVWNRSVAHGGAWHNEPSLPSISCFLRGRCQRAGNIKKKNVVTKLGGQSASGVGFGLCCRPALTYSICALAGHHGRVSDDTESITLRPPQLLSNLSSVDVLGIIGICFSQNNWNCIWWPLSSTPEDAIESSCRLLFFRSLTLVVWTRPGSQATHLT